MALKALMLRKKIDEAKKALADLRTKDEEFVTREEELKQSIEEATTEDEQKVVEEAVEAFEAEKKEHDENVEKLESEISELEGELNEEEEAQATEPEEAPAEERKEVKTMQTRENINEMVLREDVKEYLGEIRTAIREKRAVTNVGLTVPEVMLGIIRENVIDYSKLYKHVNVKRVNGEGRAVIMGTIPEAVWTDCCANLNELALTFNDVEIDCWKVGGYFAVCNANLEDSDIDLASELLRAIGQAIGLALDKAILYGLGTRMPLGVVTRLAQTAAPADYPATARPWVDLSSTNIISIAAGKTGAELVAAIVGAFGNAKGKYSRGEKVFVMNEKTYTALGAATVSTAADGSIVTGVFDRMPVVGGIIEVLDFIPDNVIIGGYFDLYLLAERAGQKFASSEHVRFLNDQTVFKGTARYDGQPAIAEGFVAIGLEGTTPDDEMTFAPDEANEEEEG